MSSGTVSRKPGNKATEQGFRVLEGIIKNLELRIKELEQWKKAQGG